MGQVFSGSRMDPTSSHASLSSSKRSTLERPERTEWEVDQKWDQYPIRNVRPKSGIPCQWEVSHLSSSSKCDEIAWRKREKKNISTTHEKNQVVGVEISHLLQIAAHWSHTPKHNSGIAVQVGKTQQDTASSGIQLFRLDRKGSIQSQRHPLQVSGLASALWWL